MPKAIAIETDRPRRRGKHASAVALIDAPAERGWLLRALLYSPKDLVAGLVAFAAVSAIISNAVFLQAGRHPSPMFGSTVVMPLSSQPVVNPLPRPRPLDAARPADKSLDASLLEGKAVETKPRNESAVKATPAAAPRAAATPAVVKDPVGDLINTTRRISSVQRALTEYGYGQLKTTGTIGPETRAAIEKFERERKMPVTGQMSDRLARELSAVTGKVIE